MCNNYCRAKGGGGYLNAIENQVVKLCKKKSKEGYILLFKTYEKYIYYICFHYTRSKEDSLDLVQEIYLKIYQSFDKFEETRPLLPWIKRITVNTCLNYIRDNRKRVNLDSEEVLAIADASGKNTVEERIDYLDTRSVLHEAMQTLPPEMKMVLLLRHQEELSYSSIADMMNLPVGTVKTYLFRGRNILRQKLKNEGLLGV